MAGGKTEAIFSGYGATNTYEYRRVVTRGYAETAITVKVVSVETDTQGLTYIVRGHPFTEGPVEGSIPSISYTLQTGTNIQSGQSHYLLIGDTHDSVSVGVKNQVTDKSGVITVIVGGKRRT